MRTAIRGAPGRSSALIRSLPPPIGGLNFMDAITALPKTDCLILDNWFAAPGSIELRRGYVQHANGMPAVVETVVEHAGASPRYFAASGSGLYDITAPGTVGSPVVTGLGSARFQTTMFPTLGGFYLVLVNGVDGVRTYDGTTWAQQTITGAPAANFRNVAVYGSRLWFTASGSTVAYYLGTGAIAGAAQPLDLGPQFARGGALAFIAPVSQANAGTGPTEMLAFVSDRGEFVLYTGGDPATAATWRLVGRYRMGRPTGDRCYSRYGGDVGVMTEDGMVTLLGMMAVDVSQSQRVAVTNKIDAVLTRQRRANSSAFGWQVFVYPGGNRVMVNAPQADGTTQQWVINVLTGAWSRFTAMEAKCWGLLGSEPYFGAASGVVHRADTGNSDNGAAIRGEVKFGFSDFGSRAAKRFTMLRPLFTANGDPVPAVGIDVDYGDVPPTDILANATSTALWGTAVWGDARWGGAAVGQRAWTAVSGLGIAGAPRLRTSTIGFDIQLHGVDVAYEPAGAAALL